MTLDADLIGLLNTTLKYWDLPQVFRAEMTVEETITALAVMIVVPDAGRSHQHKVLTAVLKKLANNGKQTKAETKE